MGVANHGPADIQTPNFGIRETFFQGHRKLAATAAEIEDTLHLTVFGYWQAIGRTDVDFVLVVPFRP